LKKKSAVSTFSSRTEGFCPFDRLISVIECLFVRFLQLAIFVYLKNRIAYSIRVFVYKCITLDARALRDLIQVISTIKITTRVPQVCFVSLFRIDNQGFWIICRVSTSSVMFT
jgi:hypothetical protein